jgi:septum formation protein
VRLVLASGSRYRRALLESAGFDVVVDPPEVDERALDGQLRVLGPEGLALELARRKLDAVRGRHPGAVVVAGDQVGILEGPEGPALLGKRPTFDAAVAQLRSMSGRTHRLVNGLVVLDTSTGRRSEGVDVQVVRFRDLTDDEIARYVRRFEPFDTAGSYRLEDQEEMGPGEGFVVSVEGEDPSGVLGLPLPLLGRLLERIAS